jgi:enolase-phosphatase E1
VTDEGAPARVQGIVLDIEGTTTPLAFVTDVLFPYARRWLGAYLSDHAASDDLAPIFDLLRAEHSADSQLHQDVPPWIEAPPAARAVAVAGYVEWAMDRDRKTTGLKALQGKIWDDGYRRGDLIGAVFDDVPRAFARWAAASVAVTIFSSGSALAQKLLFRHSRAGDLTPFLSRYFDTTIGPKTEAGSYERIALELRASPGNLLFVSDAIRELDAARTAGMQTRLSLRPGNPPVPSGHGHESIESLDELAVVPV